MKIEASGLRLRKERVWSVWREGGWGRAAPTQHRGWEEDRSWQSGLETVPLRMRMFADAVRCKVVGVRKQCPSCAG